MRAAADLVADGGASATVEEEFFRCSAFLEAEGVTHTLSVRWAEGAARIPVIVRDVPGAEGECDAISPYGYPGASLSGDADGGRVPAPGEVDWSATGLVSVFVRERVAGPACLGEATERGEILLHDPAGVRSVRRRLAEQCRAVERQGYELAVISGAEADPVSRAGFTRAYSQTMSRREAAERYRFDEGYFERVLATAGTTLVALRSPGGDVAAGAIVVRSDGLLHYYLGGTAEEHLERSPFKLVMLSMLDLADAEGMAINLGGGVSPGDGLERFKRGFANASATFRTHEVVCDRERYARLTAVRDAPEGAEADFFPAYRTAG